MKLTCENGITRLFYKGRTVLEHSTDNPFVKAESCSQSYKTSHGSFAVKSKKTAEFALIDIKTKVAEDAVSITFESGGISLKADFITTKTALICALAATEGYGYVFKFASDKDEAFFGGGEQYRQLNLKGEKVENLVSEHIKILPIVQKTVLGFLSYKEKKHKDICTYSPMTTFVSSKKYALRFDIESYGVADFTQDDYSLFSYADCPHRFIYVCGESFEEVGRALNADTPCREYLPDWAYDGMIIGAQGGIDRVEKIADDMQKAGAAVVGVWCQDWCGKKVTAVGSQVYWNWEQDAKTYPDLKNRIKRLNEKGIRFLAYINPYLVKDGSMYNYFRDNDYLIKNKKGEVYLIKSTTFDAGMIDLTNPNAVQYLKETIIQKNMLDLGVDGYMADFGEYLPMDSVLHEGDAEKLHNAWPTIWSGINREAIDSHPRAKEVFFFTRSGYNGVQSQTTMMWTGDQHTDFSKDYGMPCVLPATFNLGFSGVTAVHSDIGGFISFGSLARDKEVFIRWMEMNALSPLLRSHETIRPDKNAQPYDQDVLPLAAKLTRLHKSLKPYIMACMQEANLGLPVMRPDFYDSGDYTRHKDLYSYMLGKEVAVYPIITRGANSRKVNLPEGEWIALADGKVFAGGKAYEVGAPLGTPVAFFRKGGKYQDVFDKAIAEFSKRNN